MNLDVSAKSLPVFAALDSNVRLTIIQLLSKRKMNVTELAFALNLSNAITTKHLDKLEAANIIKTEKKGKQRVSSLTVDTINIGFPKKVYTKLNHWHLELPIGQYTNFHVAPTCGLAGQQGFIGKVDNPSYFMNPLRYQAGMLWFAQGFIEYQMPNYLKANKKLFMIELTMELSSEFPFSNNRWPSDITVSLDNHEIGTWTSPGDFSDVRGRYTPSWVYNDMNQYGILKSFRISRHGSFIDGQRSSNTKISDIDLTKPSWTLRFEVKTDSKNQGGCTIFGNKFGNHDQGIKGTFYYSHDSL
ncbi:MAG: ArsR family transcriptional regulator [Lactobacillus sp.]|uniref:ArsR/SmtB family transcription factor n=1 Tax=Bombilactobacillus bombi TaxID=1303590 RepID=UPI0035E5D576|nr:ArsR family transcriptional regulator [Lactobacillus sp.]